MDANSRADLHKQHVSALPKLQVRQSVLEYVKSQATFSKAHAAEGHAYMASWSNKEVVAAGATQRTAHSVQDIGFATPILKPRVPRVQDSKTQVDSRRLKLDITNATQADSRSRHANRSSKAVTQEKLTRAPLPREPRKGKVIPKRAQNIQSDEENRLQERRDRKRAKREIVRPEWSLIKKGGGHRDGEGQPSSKSKPNKIKLPAGLALMHGFTATNVGKHRLTIDPPIRPGVFGKGKASAPTRVGEKTNKGTNTNRIFSEEQFLGSVPRIELTSSPPRSRSSQASSERADDQSWSPHSAKLHKPCTRVGVLQLDAETAISAEKSIAKPLSLNPTGLQQSPYGTRSIIWDIEKDDGALPSDSSSLGPGPKPSTILLDVAFQKPVADSPALQIGPAASQQKSLDGQPASPGACTGPPKQVAQASSPSAISSIRPSESPSQAIIAGQRNTIPEPGLSLMRSKYFGTHSPPRMESDKETVAVQPLGAIAPPPPEWRQDVPEMRPRAEGELRTLDIDHDGLGLELGSLLGEDAIHLAQWHGNGADWLFSDPNISDNLSGQEENGIRPLMEEVPGPDLPWDEDRTQHSWKPDCYGAWESPEEGFLHGVQTRGGMSEDDEHLFTERACSRSCNTDSIGRSPIQPPFYNLPEEPYDPDPALDEMASNVFSYEQGLNESIDDERNSTASLMLFNEGRNLLLGYTTGVGQPTHWKSANSVIESIEADVAKHLVGHWMPQKY